MTTTPGASDGSAGSRAIRPEQYAPPADVDELRADIAHTRAELGETVQALAAKVDVKARLQETRQEAKARVREGLQNAAEEARLAAVEAPERAQELATRTGRAVRRNPVPFVVAAGAAALIVLFVRWRRSRW
ncbi:DUF3618 domain-containing protein [Planosporangium thailandense]|uniref:DUF3618 domain-containing protein n=1 Tax=Planosporangium thailandense TaxID=765197 RepID=A0ABX0XXA7_9ACTN|nr:DUF3618 domain-containing protein [Planosporangium thailandense]NJC70443.1 DUF3618 domain-containing protein [Planosporangium thailandense]